MSRVISNYTFQLDIIVPYGFPIRLEIPVTGYTLVDGVSSGRLLVRGPGTGRATQIDTTAKTIIDTVNNKYIVNIEPTDSEYFVLAEGKIYSWSFTADGDLFRVQGDLSLAKDTGHSPMPSVSSSVHLGELTVEVIFQAGIITGAVTSVFERTGDIAPEAGDYSPEQVGADPTGTVKYRGIAGDILSGHRVVFSDGNALFYADKDIPTSTIPIVGITEHAAILGAEISTVFAGIIAEPSWAWDMTKLVFLGSNGALTQTPPLTGVLLVIGKPISPTELLVNICEPITLH